jgi:hypothetical protein
VPCLYAVPSRQSPFRRLHGGRPRPSPRHRIQAARLRRHHRPAPPDARRIFHRNGTVVWDAGNSLEHIAVEHGLYPDGFEGVAEVGDNVCVAIQRSLETDPQTVNRIGRYNTRTGA